MNTAPSDDDLRALQAAAADLPLGQQRILARLLVDLRRPTVTFLSPSPGRYEIDGQPLDCNLRGMAAAWAAIARPGEQIVRAADHAEPGAQHASGSVRQGLKRAAALLERYSPALARVVAEIEVKAGYVRHHRGQVDVITDISRSSRVRAIADGAPRALNGGMPEPDAPTMRITVYAGAQAIAAAIPGIQAGGMNELFGKHVAVVADVDEDLLGYTIVRVAPVPLLFGGEMCASNLAFLTNGADLFPDIDRRLVGETERVSKMHGATRMLWNAPPGSPLEAVLKSAGYEVAGHRYASDLQ